MNCAYYPECQQPTGVCIETQRMPTPHWNFEFTMAVEIYFKTIQLSGCDFNGIPQLTMLEFVMEHTECELDDDEMFIYLILELHHGMISTRNM